MNQMMMMILQYAAVSLLNPALSATATHHAVKRDEAVITSSSIVVDMSYVLNNINTKMFGMTFQEHYFAGEGGLYAELIRNRDFEALGRGELGDGSTSTTPWVAVSTDYRPWNATVISGNATIGISTASRPFAKNPHVLAIEFDDASVVELSNPGYWGINCRSKMSYTGSFWMRADVNVTAEIYLRGSSTATIVSSVFILNVTSGLGWNRYNFTLIGISDRPDAIFEMVLISTAHSDNDIVYLDSVSLFPGDAVAGIFRKDIFDLLAAAKPSFLKFPGGNYMQGYATWTRWNWKSSIGEPAARAGHYNDAWGYWTHDGLGYHEYLLLCELLGAKPLLSVFTGFLVGQSYVDYNASGQYFKDAVDAIHYANGVAGNTYADIRIARGHPLSFKLDMIQIGSQESLMAQYAIRYSNISKTVLAAYPNTTIFASGWWYNGQSGGISTSGNPCITESSCAAWDEHYSMRPDDMALSYANKYSKSSYTRGLPNVYVGEYAASVGDAPTLQSALAEAAFMMGFETASDLVIHASFSTLLSNSNLSSSPSYSMIKYDNNASITIPSYEVQKMFKAFQCTASVQMSYTNVANAAACLTANGTLIVKVVNYASTLSKVTMSISGTDEVSSNCTMLLLTAGSSDATNTFSNPNNVVVKSSIIAASTSFSTTIPAWSFAVFAFQPISHTSCASLSSCSKCLADSFCTWCGTCVASSNTTACGSVTKVSVCPTASSNDGTSNTAAIIGGVVGGAGVLLSIASIIAAVMVRKIASKRKAPNLPIEIDTTAFVPTNPTDTTFVSMFQGPSDPNTYNSSGSSGGGSHQQSFVPSDDGLVMQLQPQTTFAYQISQPVILSIEQQQQPQIVYQQ